MVPVPVPTFDKVMVPVPVPTFEQVQVPIPVPVPLVKKLRFLRFHNTDNTIISQSA